MTDNVNECIGVDITPQTTSEAAWLTNVVGVDAITADYPAGYAGLFDGARFAFEAVGANTGAVTLNGKSVVQIGGAALTAGDIPSVGTVVEVFYTLSADHFHAQLIRQPSTATPLVNSGTGAVGTSTRYSRGDHIHPLLNSLVRVHTSNGYGSINTKIPRFTNVLVNQGADITYADSATLGASFTINTSGNYSVSFSFVQSAAGSSGVSLNSTQLSTGIGSINANDRLGLQTVQGAYAANFGATIYLAAGSVIRPHNDGIASGSPTNDTFIIERV